MELLTICRVTPFANDLALLQMSQVLYRLITGRSKWSSNSHDLLRIDQGQIGISQTLVGWVGHAGMSAGNHQQSRSNGRKNIRATAYLSNALARPVPLTSFKKYWTINTGR